MFDNEIPSRVIALLAAVLLTTVSTSLSAVVRERSHLQNGSGACQPSLPAFEGLVRKRPLAIQNESVGSAFVSCSMVGHSTVGFGVDQVFVGLINNSASPTSVTCTLVDGVANGTNRYITKTISVPTEDWVQIGWTGADIGGNRYQLSVNASCNLPAGTGISYTIVYYEEDVGA